MILYLIFSRTAFSWANEPRTEARRHLEHAETANRLSQATGGGYDALEQAIEEYLLAQKIPAPNWGHEIVAILTEKNQQTGNSG